MNVATLYALFGVRVDSDSVNKALGAIGKIAGRLRALAAIRVVKNLARDMVGFAEKTADAATHLQAMAISAGMGVGQMQEWQYIVDVAGGSTRDFATGLSMAERNLRLVSEGRGGKNLRAVFAELGTDASAARAALASPDGLQKWLEKTADTVKRLGSTPRTGALLSQMFGARSGRAIAADLAGGSARIEALMAQRRAMGELSGGDVGNLKNLRQEWHNLRLGVEATAQIALAKLAPAMQGAIQQAEAWITAHRDLISGVVTRAFDLLVKAIKALAPAIAGALHLLDWLTGDSWTAKVAVDALAVALGVGLVRSLLRAGLAFVAFAERAYVAIMANIIPAVIDMGVALWTAMAPILPFVALFVAVAAASFLATRYIQNHWQGIKAWFSDFWEWLSEKSTAVWDGIKDAAASVRDFFVGIWDAVADAATKAAKTIRNLPVLKQAIDLAEGTAHVAERAAGAVAGAARGAYHWLRGSPTVASYPTPSIRMPTASAGGGASSNFSANTTININGVRGAEQVAPAVSNATEQANRHAYASLTGGR